MFSFGIYTANRMVFDLLQSDIYWKNHVSIFFGLRLQKKKEQKKYREKRRPVNVTTKITSLK